METKLDENIVGEELLPKQERFCRNYTQNYEFFGNATLSYAEAYGYDIDNEPDDDAIYDIQGVGEVMEKDLELLTDEQFKGKKKIKESSRKTMYDLCSSYGSRLRRNDKIQARSRVLLNEFLRDDVIDARLAEIALKGDDKDAIQAIKEFNKLKQRIIDKKDITSGGERIAGFNFIRADQHFVDARTEEEREEDSKIEVKVTTSSLPEPTIIKNDGGNNTNNQTDS